jgi:molybdate transport system permease protein
MNLTLTPAESEALLLSLRISLVAVLCALPFAVAAALLLARTRFVGKTLVDGLIHVPLVLPPVAIGFLLLTLFGTRGSLGGFLLVHFGIRFVFSWTGAALASAIITFPFQVRAIRLALEGLDKSLNQAAQTPVRPGGQACQHHLAASLPGIVRAPSRRSRQASARFGAIITFVSNIPGQTRTLPLAIYTALQAPGGDVEAARLSVISILLALLFMSLAEIAARRARAGA